MSSLAAPRIAATRSRLRSCRGSRQGVSRSVRNGTISPTSAWAVTPLCSQKQHEQHSAQVRFTAPGNGRKTGPTEVSGGVCRRIAPRRGARLANGANCRDRAFCRLPVVTGPDGAQACREASRACLAGPCYAPLPLHKVITIWLAVLPGHVVLGSIEFGPSAYPPARLIFVLGHERCGAVLAAIGVIQTGKPAPGHIQAVVNALRPAYQVAAREPGDLVENMVRAQTRLTVERLERDHLLRKLIENEGLKIVGGHYSLGTGRRSEEHTSELQ